MELKVMDCAKFCCRECETPVAITEVVLTEAFTYIFYAECPACEAVNQFALNSILNSLCPKIVADGSKLVN